MMSCILRLCVNGDSTTMFCRNGNMSSPVGVELFQYRYTVETLEFCSKKARCPGAISDRKYD